MARFALQRWASAPKADGTWEADKLRENERTEHVVVIDADFVAIGGRKLDDRADAVVVEPK